MYLPSRRTLAFELVPDGQALGFAAAARTHRSQHLALIDVVANGIFAPALCACE